MDMATLNFLRVLMVTREIGNDRRYGLGKSLAPVVEALRDSGVMAQYICQDDLPASWQSWRARWLKRISSWPGFRGRLDRRVQLSAWSERLWMGFWAARLARDQAFSHVHLHDPWMGLGFRLAAWRMCLGSVRWGVTEHGCGSYSFATHVDGLHQGRRSALFFRRLEAQTLAAADWVFCPTQTAAEQLARDLALPSVPAHWHVVAHPRPARTSLSSTAARSLLNWSPHGIYVLAVGRLVPLKNMDWIVQACGALMTQFDHLHLCILGEGDQARFRQLAKDAGFGDRLLLDVTDDVTPFLHAADVYVSASSTESFGLANLEAMCAGLPCLCTAVGGVPDVMSDGAWLVACEQDSLTRALAALLQNASLRDIWRSRAQARADAWPDAHSIAQIYAQVYSALSPPQVSS
jgi:glycosyltransferase involved in cell wall biosynthesis